jgi:hypothetical protein
MFMVILPVAAMVGADRERPSGQEQQARISDPIEDKAVLAYGHITARVADVRIY